MQSSGTARSNYPSLPSDAPLSPCTLSESGHAKHCLKKSKIPISKSKFHVLTSRAMASAEDFFVVVLCSDSYLTLESYKLIR